MLPLQRAVRAGAAMGALVLRCDQYNRSIAQRNLKIAFGDLAQAERALILRQAYANFGRMAAEWVHAADFNRANIERFAHYSGREHWEEALRRSAGRGILILTGHFGNFELLSLAHSIYGNQAAIVQRPNRNPMLDLAITTRRHRFGNITVARKGAAREVVRLLSDDWMVGVALDLDTRHGAFVDFFGTPAATSPALARIAMLSGAPVLPFFMLRQDNDARHQMTFLPVVEVRTRGDRRECVLENTQNFTSIIEAMIRRHPDHWNWIHRRWKTRPDGQPRFY